VIGRLNGTLLEASGGIAVINVGGVGYEVFVPDPVYLQLPLLGEPVELYVRMMVREDSISLCGFWTAYQRRLFDLLLGVSGCGVKSALSLLGLGEETVATAIANSDGRMLARATGVGVKLAEKIIIDLKGKVTEEQLIHRATSTRVAVRIEDELVDALLALGYRRNEAETAADKARGQAETVEEQIRLALRELRN
jgi:holliday junction DNA helicase RuvA